MQQLRLELLHEQVDVRMRESRLETERSQAELEKRCLQFDISSLSEERDELKRQLQEARERVMDLESQSSDKNALMTSIADESPSLSTDIQTRTMKSMEKEIQNLKSARDKSIVLQTTIDDLQAKIKASERVHLAVKHALNQQEIQNHKLLSSRNLGSIPSSHCADQQPLIDKLFDEVRELKQQLALQPDQSGKLGSGNDEPSLQKELETALSDTRNARISRDRIVELYSKEFKAYNKYLSKIFGFRIRMSWIDKHWRQFDMEPIYEGLRIREICVRTHTKTDDVELRPTKFFERLPTEVKSALYDHDSLPVFMSNVLLHSFGTQTTSLLANT